jgi:hypothetical protein
MEIPVPENKISPPETVRGLGRGDGEGNGNLGSSSYFTFYMNGTSVHQNDPFTYDKPEAGSFFFRSDKWKKDMFQHFL